MEDYAVRVEHLTKVYKIYKKPWHRAVQALFRNIPHEDFYALNDVTLEFGKGEAIGIIGKNGNGKSTLLKLITGVTQPTGGKAEHQGRIVAMLELTSGFDKELSGRDNIYIKGLTLGMSRAEIDRKIPDILAFADIDRYIDQPVRTYSSGMKSRLGFAVSVNMEPDILIVDEVLAVGDTAFKLKCLAKMEEFRKLDKTILFVSHDLATVKAFCTQCVWLQNGRVAYQGNTGTAVQMYQDFLKAERAKENEKRREDNVAELLEKDDVIYKYGACLKGSDGEKKNVFSFGEDLVVYSGYEIKKELDDCVCVMTIFDAEGNEVYGSDRQAKENRIDSSLGKHALEFTVHDLCLIPGNYFVTCTIWNNTSGFNRNLINKKEFRVESEKFIGTGIVHMDLELHNVKEV